MKDNQRVFKELKKQGWCIELRRSSHYKLTAPGGGIYFAAGTPSDHRDLINMVTSLRRMGARL